MTWTPLPPIKDDDIKWYAIDFDLTLANSSGHPDYHPTTPIWENVAKLEEVKNAGYKVVIHTARPSHDYQNIESWLNHYSIPYDRIETGKLFAKKYIDDKAVNANERSWV
jgi:hydroxymethylpyrimidine pyrophosphatase-like HAD family hydrolase